MRADARKAPAGERKTEILEAACRVIARRGVRGLRIEELAREAGVSTALIYYYFEGRATLLQRALEYVSARAFAYTEPEPAAATSARTRLEAIMLREFQDSPLVYENSVVWGELWASAVFETELRADLARSGQAWVTALAQLIRAGQDEGTINAAVVPDEAAERLSAIVNGLSAKWLIGALTLERARLLVRGAVEREFGACPSSAVGTSS